MKRRIVAISLLILTCVFSFPKFALAGNPGECNCYYLAGNSRQDRTCLNPNSSLSSNQNTYESCLATCTANYEFNDYKDSCVSSYFLKVGLNCCLSAGGNAPGVPPIPAGIQYTQEILAGVTGYALACGQISGATVSGTTCPPAQVPSKLYCCTKNTSTNLYEAASEETFTTDAEYNALRNTCIAAQKFPFTAVCAGTQTEAAATDASMRDRATTPPTTTPATTTAALSGRVTLPNPLGTTSPEEIIGRVIKALLSIVGSLALLMFIYGGILWLTAGGSSEGVKKGQGVIKWSVAGILLIFTAYIILRYVLGALQGTFTP